MIRDGANCGMTPSFGRDIPTITGIGGYSDPNWDRGDIPAITGINGKKVG